MSVMIAGVETTAKIADLIYRIVKWGYEQERFTLSNASVDFVRSIWGSVDGEREQRIFEVLQSLNYNSYDARYGGKANEQYEYAPYKPARFKKTDEFYRGENGSADYQKLKSVQFFKYQCDEHDNSPVSVKIYALLEEIERSLLYNTIQNTPEWKMAKWE